MLGNKVADALLTFLHLTDINRLIARERVGRYASRRTDDLVDIAIGLNSNQQNRLFVSALFDGAEERAFYRLDGFKQRGQESIICAGGSATSDSSSVSPPSSTSRVLSRCPRHQSDG